MLGLLRPNELTSRRLEIVSVMFIKSDTISPTIEIPPAKLLSSGRKLVTPEQRALMVTLYQDGFSTWKIGEAFGYLNVCVINNLKKAGLTLRNRSDANKTISINREYWDVVDTPTKAYLLGFFYADGNMHNDSFTIALQERDKYVLEDMAKEMGYTGELSFRKKQAPNKQNMWALRIHDKVFAESLRRIGIVARKTSNLEFPKFLDKNLVYAFLHGISDGDGCISVYDKRSLTYSLAGSEQMILDVQQIIKNDLGLDLKFRHITGSKGKTGTLTGRSALTFLHKMYLSGSKFCLSRKKDKFFDFLSSKRKYAEQNIHSRAVTPLSFYDNILKDFT